MELLRRAGHAAARIGSLTSHPGQYQLEDNNGVCRGLPEFAVDELATDAAQTPARA